MESKECWLVDFEGVANSIDKGFRFDSKLSNLIDNDDFAVVDGMLDGRDSYTLKLSGVEAISKDSQS